MPELAEVEFFRQRWHQAALGESVRQLLTHDAKKLLRELDLPAFRRALIGARLESSAAAAKQMLFRFSGNAWLGIHLGMSGALTVAPPDHAPGKHDHLVIETGDHAFALHDPRRFGFVDLVETARLDAWPPFAAMGPEPLGPGLTPGHLQRAFAGRRQAVKLLLLDQRIVAGLGNIYVCEALFRAAIDPRKPAGRVARAAIARLVPAIREVLEQAIGDGGSTLRDYARPDGELGYFATRFAVYGREGQPCARGDGGVVARIVQGGRSTWFCPKCQK